MDLIALAQATDMAATIATVLSIAVSVINFAINSNK
jgi:hypothetical protein